MTNKPTMDTEGAFESEITYNYKYDGLNRLVHAQGTATPISHPSSLIPEPRKFERAYGYANNGNLTRKDIIDPENHAVQDRWSYNS